MRGIFFDPDTAEVVRGLLVSDGYAAEVTPERYAGEDDDEDHAWAVRTDAPAIVLELLVDAYEGWLDDDSAAPPPTPLDLPTTPRRHHGQQAGYTGAAADYDLASRQRSARRRPPGWADHK